MTLVVKGGFLSGLTERGFAFLVGEEVLEAGVAALEVGDVFLLCGCEG